jgi:hypothetical protein
MISSASAEVQGDVPDAVAVVGGHDVVLEARGSRRPVRSPQVVERSAQAWVGVNNAPMAVAVGGDPLEMRCHAGRAAGLHLRVDLSHRLGEAGRAAVGVRRNSGGQGSVATMNPSHGLNNMRRASWKAW